MKKLPPNTVQNFYSITFLKGTISQINTASLFDKNHTDPINSPIDKFIENTNKLNILCFSSTSISREMGTIIFLGYMSAVESYMRAMIRTLINIDPYIANLAEPKELTFGAAMHHSKTLLPEALMDRTSFSSAHAIKESLRDFLGIKGELESDVKATLAEYAKICELRHCCVHRFGRLGAKNAISLGLISHKLLLEKPVTLDKPSLEEISEFLRIFIKTLNNFIFRKILERSALNKDDKGNKLYSEEWTWNYTKDRKRFKSYYDLCASIKDARPSPSMKDAYTGFRMSHQKPAATAQKNKQRKSLA